MLEIMLRFMEQTLSEAHGFLRTSINKRESKIASGDKLQKKKGIANILLDFGLFVLHENKFIFVRQKASCNIGV